MPKKIVRELFAPLLICIGIGLAGGAASQGSCAASKQIITKLEDCAKIEVSAKVGGLVKIVELVLTKAAERDWRGLLDALGARDIVACAVEAAEDHLAMPRGAQPDPDTVTGLRRAREYLAGAFSPPKK
jgi:hypothetical protein